MVTECVVLDSQWNGRYDEISFLRLVRYRRLATHTPFYRYPGQLSGFAC